MQGYVLFYLMKVSWKVLEMETFAKKITAVSSAWISHDSVVFQLESHRQTSEFTNEQAFIKILKALHLAVMSDSIGYVN